MRIDFLRPYLRFLPEVAPPKRPPSLEDKFKITGIVLLIYFTMYHVYPIGVNRTAIDATFHFIQMIMASNMGTILTAGIGPIVLSSIFLQLFVGAKIIDLNLSNPQDRVLFQGTQKLLAIVLCFVEAFLYTNGLPLIERTTPIFLLVALQIAIGSLILIFFDEVTSKYGLGSGVSLFIAAGVSLAIVQGTLFYLLPGVFYYLTSGDANAIANAILTLLPFIFMLIVFASSAFAEGVAVHIPIMFDRMRGAEAAYPVKFLYVSNLPVILTSAMLLSLNMWTVASGFAHWDVGVSIGGHDITDYIAWAPRPTSHDQQRVQLQDGLLFYLTRGFPTSPIYLGLTADPQSITGQRFDPEVGYTTYIRYFVEERSALFGIPNWVHLITYSLFFVGLCIVFGYFWIETIGMSPQNVAEQLFQAGLSQPGYRRDPRVIKRKLAEYIYPVAIMGSAFVGFLAIFADLTGALGTGTGVLLTVGILYRMYEDLLKQGFSL